MENLELGTYVLDQNAHIEPQVYAVKYPQLQYANIVSVDTGAPEWVDVIVKRTMDSSGEPKWMDSKGNVIPRVEIGTGVTTHPVYQLELGYDWAEGEIQRAMAAGVSLEADRAIAVGRSFEEKSNVIALFGDAEKKFDGMYNSPAVPLIASAPSIRNIVEAISVTGGMQEAVTYFQEKINKVYLEQTNSVYRPNAIAIPLRDLELLRATIIPGGGTATLLPYLEANLSVTFIGDILLGKGQTGKNGEAFLTKDRMVVLTRDIDVAKFHLPMAMRFRAPYTNDQKNFHVDAMLRTGGVEIRIPDAMLYVELEDYVAP
jgi:hypothetical protein